MTMTTKDMVFNLRLDEETHDDLDFLKKRTGLAGGMLVRALIKREAAMLRQERSVPDKQYQRIRDRARLKGESGVSFACPRFFRARVMDAQEGGGRSYKSVGFTFARSIFDIYGDESEEEAKALDATICDARTTTDAAHALFMWARTHLPRCIELVPPKRVDAFLEGIKAAIDEGKVCR
jgi:hypothetical protein